MNKIFALIALLLVTSLNISCGSGGRQLQSISISQTVNGQQPQFVATGTFSAPPTTVSPLPVFWYVGLQPAQYTLTTQPALCSIPVSTMTLNLLTAIAPAEPNAASSGSISATKMVNSTASYSCALVQE